MGNAAILASFAWQAAYSLAAPTPNTTAIVTPVADPGWKKEPKGRGTFSIILTSVLTLGLCVWTAIHPNVKPNASAWEKVKHRLSYVLIGMLAPELVLAVAFDEWWTARCFHREWCDLYEIEPGSKEDILRMKGAFFVTMGGVSFVPTYKVPASFENILSADAYLQLARTNTKGELLGVEEFKKLLRPGTAHAVVEAAKTGEAVELLGLDPDICASGGEEPGSLDAAPVGREPEEVVAEMVLRQDFVHYREVQDKGKAEVLGKTLVCLQALWMLVQCIVRKASGLPVTLLEIHVAMHVICAMGMYIFWFNKPQDVGEPLPIPANIVFPVSDPMQLYVESMKRISHRYQGHSLKIRLKGNIENLRGSVSSYQSHRPLPTTKSVHFPGLGILPRLTRSIIHGKNHRPTAPAVADPERLVIPYGHMLDLGSVRVYNDADLWRTCVMPFDDLDFLTRVAKAYEVGKRPKWRPDIQLLNHISFQSDRKGDILDDIHVSNIFPAILILLAYGACHAAAWNTHFPSPVERLLWRISSVVIAVVPAYALFLVTLDNGDHDTLWNVLTLFMFKMLNLFDGVGRVHIMGINLNIREIYKRTFSVLVFTPLFIICLAVPVGRLYLFIESFLSLRSLPYGSFDSTPWEDYFPHF